MNNKRSIILTGVIIIAVAFIVLGVLRKETEPIFAKAVNICLECIGLGK